MTADVAARTVAATALLTALGATDAELDAVTPLLTEQEVPATMAETRRMALRLLQQVRN